MQPVSVLSSAAVRPTFGVALAGLACEAPMFSSSAGVGYAAAANTVEKDKATSSSEPAGEAVLADLYAKYAPAIYAHCRRFLQSPAAARDATQEAFVRVIARGVVLPREEEALRYLYRVSTNVCLNLLREHNVHTRAVPALAANASHAPSAESGLADREFVTAVMERCGEGGAQVAILHYLDGMSQVDIAETLGITRRTVFNRLRKLSRIAGDLLHAGPRSTHHKDAAKERK
jgi:RNA polymerase sigma-70 factor (ECF subfamily)